MNDISSLPTTLAGWLQYIEALHPKSIAMGLDRVLSVKERLGLDPEFPIITVGGTNGKGSTCAMLESVYDHAGYKVACYTSPHILRYNERVRINAKEVSDEALCTAFQQVEIARGGIALTYFEFGTLAALWLFAEANIDVAVLEVGLGGRLDAVNAFDANCAVVTSIDLDHMEFLGNTRESIGFEKAGIYRKDKPAICAEPLPPQTLLDHASRIGARLLQINMHFGCRQHGEVWDYLSPQYELLNLPLPSLEGDFQLNNAAAVITAIQVLQPRLPVDNAAIERGIASAKVAGRFQRFGHSPETILDVAHNPHAARALANNLNNATHPGRTLAVFAMLADKDIPGVIAATASHIQCWYVADIHTVRGALACELEAKIVAIEPEAVIHCFPNVADAYRQACLDAAENDRIIVFGSFFTVADVMQLLPDSNRALGQHRMLK